MKVPIVSTILGLNLTYENSIKEHEQEGKNDLKKSKYIVFHILNQIKIIVGTFDVLLKWYSPLLYWYT